MAAPEPHVVNILDRLKKVRRGGTGWNALCPSHEDSTPSLTIGIGAEGRVLLNCHRGCAIDDITAALGLTQADLFKESPAKTSSNKETIYDYVDENGALIFQVVRKRLPDGRKDFRQRRPDGGGGWTWSTTGIRKPLYRLPQVLKAVKEGTIIWIAEGEKDVEALESRGFVATTNPGGAGKWLEEYGDVLAGGHIVLTVDKDGPGYRHGLNVADTLSDRAASFRVVSAPEPYKDAADAIAAGVSPANFVPTNLEAALGEHDPFRNVISDVRDIGKSDLSFEQKLTKLRSLVDRAASTEEAKPFGRLVKWEDFLREPTEDYEWVIPNILERGERAILVAGEGVGKTMLARQMAILLAMGIHPFKPYHNIQMSPVRTLFFDLENPEKIIRRTSKKILDEANKLYLEKTSTTWKGPMNAQLLVKPDGIDLMKAEDRAEFENIVAFFEPEIIFIGPIYKAYVHLGNQQTSQVIIEVVKFLDYIRDAYNTALWLEHHSPLGDRDKVMRPVDSGVWTRWPEFGLSLMPDDTVPNLYNVRHFRGGRDARDWPDVLRRGGAFPFEAP